MEESKYAKTDSIEEACHFPVTVPSGHMYGSPSTDASEGIFILHTWQFLTEFQKLRKKFRSNIFPLIFFHPF